MSVGKSVSWPWQSLIPKKVEHARVYSLSPFPAARLAAAAAAAAAPAGERRRRPPDVDSVEFAAADGVYGIPTEELPPNGGLFNVAKASQSATKTRGWRRADQKMSLKRCYKRCHERGMNFRYFSILLSRQKKLHETHPRSTCRTRTGVRITVTNRSSATAERRTGSGSRVPVRERCISEPGSTRSTSRYPISPSDNARTAGSVSLHHCDRCISTGGQGFNEVEALASSGPDVRSLQRVHRVTLVFIVALVPAPDGSNGDGAGSVAPVGGRGGGRGGGSTYDPGEELFLTVE